MPTNLGNRKTSRAALVTFFTSNGSWQNVYGYLPDEDTLKTKSPVLVITSGGTSQEFKGLWDNPAEYTLSVQSWVQRHNEREGDMRSDAEDQIDDLDEIMRQVIRDNAGGIAGADYLKFPPQQSITSYAEVGATQFRVETWTVIATSVDGS